MRSRALRGLDDFVKKKFSTKKILGSWKKRSLDLFKVILFFPTIINHYLGMVWFIISRRLKQIQGSLMMMKNYLLCYDYCCCDDVDAVGKRSFDIRDMVSRMLWNLSRSVYLYK